MSTEKTTPTGLPKDTSGDEERRLAHRKPAGVPIARRELALAERTPWERADKIIITGLEVFANHGVYPQEQELGQKFVVSATLYANLRPAGEHDDLSASVDYGAVCHAIDEFLREHTYKLIEAAAEALAAHLLDRYPALVAIRIKLEKPWAPIGLSLGSVAVEIERMR